MRKSVLVVVAIVLVGIIVSGALALAASPKLPPNCEPCGNDFKKVDPALCGLLFDPVDAYRASGNFVARYSNRCYACTTSGVFCTVPDVATR